MKLGPVAIDARRATQSLMSPCLIPINSIPGLVRVRREQEGVGLVFAAVVTSTALARARLRVLVAVHTPRRPHDAPILVTDIACPEGHARRNGQY
jgi:hypothetical protein